MSRIPIFMYHHVSTPKIHTPLKSLFVSPDTFRLQMRTMKLLGYKGLSMVDLYPYLIGVKKGKVFGITFDDGYEDVFNNALPTLLEFGFSSTCYVVSSEIGGCNIWDKGYEDPHPLMSRDMLHQWIDYGQDIGVHTTAHNDLSGRCSEQYVDEILNSKLFLESLFDYPCGHFCYPYGHYNKNVVDSVIKYGFKTATTTRRGVVTKSDSFFELPRLFMKSNMGPLKTFYKVKFS